MKPVYVIDDDDDVREVIVFALQNENLKVFDFNNALEALTKLKGLGTKELPGLIIVDYLMPEMNGDQFIDEIRKNGHYDSVPLALSTALGTPIDGMAQMKNVIELHKPMDLDDLINVVKKHCL